MVRTQIYIPEILHQTAKSLAERKNESLAKLLRTFIARGVEEEKKKVKPKILSSLARLNITGGPKDLSSNMNAHLYGK